MILDLLALLVANVGMFLAGAGVSRTFGVWDTPGELARTWGVVYVAGAGSMGVLSALLLVAGSSLSLAIVIAEMAVLASVGLVPWRLAAVPAAALPSGPWAQRLVWAVQATLVGFLLLYFVHDALKPLSDWDSWAMWTMKARAIVLQGGIDPAVFAGEAYRPLHRDYPLLLPALEAVDFRFMNGINTQVIHLQPLLLLIGFVAALSQMLRDRVPGVLLWPALAMITMAPSLSFQVASGSADAPLALFFALAAVAAWRWLDDGRASWAALATLFAAASAATKDEGTLYAFLFMGVCLVFSRLAGRRLWPMLLGLLLVGASVAPWLLWLHVNGVGRGNATIPLTKAYDVGYMIGRVGRLPPAAAELARHAFPIDAWLLVLPLTAVAVVLALLRRRRLLPAFFVCVIGSVLFAVLWAYWIAGVGVHWYAEHSARRTVTTLIVTSAAFLPLLLAAALPAAGRSPAPPAGAAIDARDGGRLRGAALQRSTR